VQFGVMPVLARVKTYAGGPDGVMARDRLVVGDIRNQAVGRPDPWPVSRDLGGDDAVRVEPPSAVALEVLDAAAARMHEWREVSRGLSRNQQEELGTLMQRAMVERLPGLEYVLAGITPSRVGTGSSILLAAAGLYLSYRYILRGRSVLIFTLAFIAATAFLALGPMALGGAGLRGLWEVIKVFPGELVSLLSYLIFNSDAGFAAIFVLALPGTEPLTARGRTMFLLAAGALGAGLHRLDPGIPAATLGLGALMPLSGSFDWAFGRRSWLNVKA
jgi:hypothetical protein